MLWHRNKGKAGKTHLGGKKKTPNFSKKITVALSKRSDKERAMSMRGGGKRFVGKSAPSRRLLALDTSEGQKNTRYGMKKS